MINDMWIRLEFFINVLAVMMFGKALAPIVCRRLIYQATHNNLTNYQDKLSFD
jgi:hypothetical protein